MKTIKLNRFEINDLDAYYDMCYKELVDNVCDFVYGRLSNSDYPENVSEYTKRESYLLNKFTRNMFMFDRLHSSLYHIYVNKIHKNMNHGQIRKYYKREFCRVTKEIGDILSLNDNSEIFERLKEKY